MKGRGYKTITTDWESMYQQAKDDMLAYEAENARLKEELNMLKGLVDELIDDIDDGDIGQAKKTLRRYGHG